MIDEQKFAWTLIDLKSLIQEMDENGLLTEDDYNLLKNAHNRIFEISGFVEGKL